MSRVFTFPLRGALRATSLVVGLALLMLAAAVPVAAQDVPTCTDGSAISDCVLPAWPDASLQDAPSLFGPVQGRGWVEDAVGDVAPNGLDILSVGVATVTVQDAAKVRRDPAVLTTGKVAKAVKDGRAVLVRIVLDRAAESISDGHASVHVATDIDGARTNNAPAGVGKPNGPFAGMQDVYSLTYATTTDKTKLLDSNLAKGWYRGKDPFAATWSAPGVLDMLLPRQAVGDGIRVATFVSGADGGYDTITLGPGSIPVDGQVGLLPACTEASVSAEPFTVPRLIENGQTLRDIEAPGSWIGGAAIPLDASSREALEALVATNDEDGDGVISLPSAVSIFEDGLILRQRPEIELALDGDTVQLALELGLTRRGYNVVRDIDIESTGDAAVDGYLSRAARALVQNTPSFRSNKKSGLLHGGAIGACATQLIVPPAAVVPETLPADADEAAASA